MTDDSEKAELRKKIARAERRLWATRAEMAEFEQRVANFEKAEAALMKFYKRGPHSKKKSGRPSFWKSPHGCFFVWEVETILEERKCKIATAIRTAKKNTIERGKRSKARGYTDPIIARAARLAKLSDEQLQVRYQEARRHWLFMVDPEAYQREEEALQCNLEQALRALEELAPKKNPKRSGTYWVSIVDEFEADRGVDFS